MILFISLFAFATLSTSCMGLYYMDQYNKLRSLWRDEYAKMKPQNDLFKWMANSNLQLLRFLQQHGLYEEWRKTQQPPALSPPTLESIAEEVKGHIDATKPDSEVSDVIVLPPERKEPNGSVPATGPTVH